MKKITIKEVKALRAEARKSKNTLVFHEMGTETIVFKSDKDISPLSGTVEVRCLYGLRATTKTLKSTSDAWIAEFINLNLQQQ